MLVGSALVAVGCGVEVGVLVGGTGVGVGSTVGGGAKTSGAEIAVGSGVAVGSGSVVQAMSVNAIAVINADSAVIRSFRGMFLCSPIPSDILEFGGWVTE